MVEFKTRVFSESDDEIIGAEVLVYSDNGQRLGSIEIVNAEDLESLQEELNAIPDVYVSNDDLEVILTNLNDAKVINATTLSGYNSSEFAKTSHEHVTSDITNFPSSLPPSSHTHGRLTNDGAIGSTAGKPIVTGENGVLSAGSFGTDPGTFCQGNDERLRNSRTPTSHVHGAVTNDGKVNSDISSVNKVVVTDGSNNVKTISVLPGGKLGSHNHDDRYYTESEMNTKLNGKANSSHAHGNISNDGKVNSDISSGNVNKVLVTDSSNNVKTSDLTKNNQRITLTLSNKVTGHGYITVRNGWAFIDFGLAVSTAFEEGQVLMGGIPESLLPVNFIYNAIAINDANSNVTTGYIMVDTNEDATGRGKVYYYGPNVPVNRGIHGSITYPIKDY